MPSSVDRMARVERWRTRQPAAASTRGVVSSQHFVASEAGAAALRVGGNAVDAAITAALMLQTVEPWMSGLAACGYFMVAHPNGEVDVVEFTGQVPQRLQADRYAPAQGDAKTFLGLPATVDRRNERGFTAAVVPGAVRGLALALRRFGTFGFDRALAPAIDQARRGLVVDWHTTLSIALAQRDLAADAGARQLFLPTGVPPEPGTILPLTELATTLQRLADTGPDDLYIGTIAERLLDELRTGGSPIDEDDFRRYSPLGYRAVSTSVHGATLHVPGDSSGGRRLLHALRHFDEHRQSAALDSSFYVTMAQGLWSAFDDHRQQLTPAETNGVSSTTHINAVDREGRIACITFTLLNRFGARACSPSTGILMNNGLAWFDPRPNRANSLQPGARAMNNMCPAVLTDEAGPRAALGASGGNQIVPALAQIATMLLHLDLDPDRALHAPRIHTGPTRNIDVDVDLPLDCVEALSRLATVRTMQRTVYPRPFASPAALSRHGNGFMGVADTSYPAAASAIP